MQSLDHHLLQNQLHNKYTVVIGGSVMRAVYKDLVYSLQTSGFVPRSELKARGEESFAGDVLLSGGIKNGRLHNGIGYTEVRQYVSDFNLLRFYFVTRAHNKKVDAIICGLKDEPLPDIVIMNSTLWDLTRYNAGSIKGFHFNLIKIFQQLKAILPPSCLFVWATTPPLGEIRKGVLLPGMTQSPMLHHEIQHANDLAMQLASDFGYAVLPLHIQLQPLVHLRVKDGIHWQPEAHRYITLCLSKLIWSCQGPPSMPYRSSLPNSYSGLQENINGDTLNSDAVKFDLHNDCLPDQDNTDLDINFNVIVTEEKSENIICQESNDFIPPCENFIHSDSRFIGFKGEIMEEDIFYEEDILDESLLESGEYFVELDGDYTFEESLCSEMLDSSKSVFPEVRSDCRLGKRKADCDNELGNDAKKQKTQIVATKTIFDTPLSELLESDLVENHQKYLDFNGNVVPVLRDVLNDSSGGVALIPTESSDDLSGATDPRKKTARYGMKCKNLDDELNVHSGYKEAEDSFLSPTRKWCLHKITFDSPESPLRSALEIPSLLSLPSILKDNFIDLRQEIQKKVKFK